MFTFFGHVTARLETAPVSASLTTRKHPVMAALTDEERQALLRRSHPARGGPEAIHPQDVSRLFDECRRLMLPDQSSRSVSLETLCVDMAVIRNIVCGGEAAFMLVECDPAWVGGEEGEAQASTSGRRVAGLLAAVVDTYFDADNCSNTKDDAISMLLEDANVALLAKARRVACQVVVNACSSSARWRSSIAACLFPKRFTCLALTDDVRVVGSLAYALHTMVNVDDVDPADGSPFRMEQLVQLIALMLQVEARYGASVEGDGITPGTGARTAAAADASLEIMLTHLCLRRGRLKEVVCGLSFGEPAAAGPSVPVADGNKADTVRLNSNHAYLFEALAAGAANDSLPPPDAALAYLHELIKLAWCGRDASRDNKVGPIVIRGCLHLWRDAMARESTVVSPATVSAALPTFVDILRRDEHIADVLSVIANACHRRPNVNACLLGVDGKAEGTEMQTGPAAAHDTLCLILSHARGNPNAPLAREWALLAIRNLCECSQDARDAIEALEKVQQGAAGPGGQTQNGPDSKYKVEYDANAGGWKLGVDH